MRNRGHERCIFRQRQYTANLPGSGTVGVLLLVLGGLHELLLVLTLRVQAPHSLQLYINHAQMSSDYGSDKALGAFLQSCGFDLRHTLVARARHSLSTSLWQSVSPSSVSSGTTLRSLPRTCASR